MTDHNQKGDGKYHMVRRIAVRTHEKPIFEAGKFVVVDPHGNIIFSAPYSAGGKKYTPDLRDYHVSDRTEMTTLNGGIVYTRVLRFEGHLLAHKDLDRAKSLFCFHLKDDDFKRLANLWDGIKGHKSDKLHLERDHSNEAYNQAVAMLKSKDAYLVGHDKKIIDMRTDADEAAAKAKKAGHHPVTLPKHLPAQPARENSGKRIPPHH